MKGITDTRMNVWTSCSCTLSL